MCGSYQSAIIVISFNDYTQSNAVQQLTNSSRCRCLCLCHAQSLSGRLHGTLLSLSYSASAAAPADRIDNAPVNADAGAIGATPAPVSIGRISCVDASLSKWSYCCCCCWCTYCVCCCCWGGRDKAADNCPRGYTSSIHQQTQTTNQPNKHRTYEARDTTTLMHNAHITQMYTQHNTCLFRQLHHCSILLDPRNNGGRRW